MIHTLKIENNYLDNLISGKKKSEIRLNDRDYQVGDILEFERSEAVDKWMVYRFEITHIHSGLGLEFNYVVLSVLLMEKYNDNPKESNHKRGEKG